MLLVRCPVLSSCFLLFPCSSIHPLCTFMAWRPHLLQGGRQPRALRIAVERLEACGHAASLWPSPPPPPRPAAGQATRAAGARRCAKDRPAAARSGGPAAVRLGLGAADDQVEHEARPRRGSCGRRKTTTQATAGGGARPARAAEGG